MVRPMSFGPEVCGSRTARYAFIRWLLVRTAGCADETNVRFTADAEPSEAGAADAARVDAPLPDLRFKWVGAFERYHGRAAFNVITGGQSGGLTMSAVGRAVSTALEIWMVDGPGQRASNASWAYAVFTPMQPIVSIRTTAQAGPLQTFQSDFDALIAAHHVVTSLDITSGAYGLRAAGREGEVGRRRVGVGRRRFAEWEMGDRANQNGSPTKRPFMPPMILLVLLLVEAPDQLLEHAAHHVVRDSVGWRSTSAKSPMTW
jgi:hypothetical protein